MGASLLALANSIYYVQKLILSHLYYEVLLK